MLKSHADDKINIKGMGYKVRNPQNKNRFITATPNKQNVRK